MAQPASRASCQLDVCPSYALGLPWYKPPMSLAAAGRLAGPQVAFRSARVCAMAHRVGYTSIGRHFTMLACGDEVGLWGETLPAWAWASESLSNNVTGLVSLHLIFSVIVDDLPICSFNCDTAQLLVVYCLLCGVTIPSFCCLQRSPRAS
jgi:hypothetical protein